MTSFQRIGTFSSPNNDLYQETLTDRSASAIYSDFLLDPDNTLCFLEEHKIKILPRNTDQSIICFLSTSLVVQSTSENPVISRIIEVLMFKPKLCNALQIPQYTFYILPMIQSWGANKLSQLVDNKCYVWSCICQILKYTYGLSKSVGFDIGSQSVVNYLHVIICVRHVDSFSISNFLE